MAGYENLLQEWEFNPTEDQWSGKRVLIVKSGGAYSLPSLGDAFPAGELPSGYSSSNLIARSIRVTKPSNVERWEISYSTKPWSGSDLDPDDEPEQLQVTGEIAILHNNGGKAGFVNGDGNGISAPFYKYIPTAQYSKVEVYNSFALAITGVVTAKIGNLLESASGANDGFWLYLGGDITEYRDNTGAIKAKATRKYAYKSIDDNGTARGWNYIWDQNKGSWELTVDPNNKPIYVVATTLPDTLPF